MKTRFARVGLMATLAVAWAGSAAAQSTQPARASYTTAQADSGSVAFLQLCSGCHAEDLSGAGDAPPLKGAPFAYNWDGKFANALVSFIKMNEPRPDLGTLGDATVLQVIAYVLSVNGVPAGAEPFAGGARTVIVLPGPRLR
jgi:mono/diheme cytochrome c family protein